MIKIQLLFFLIIGQIQASNIVVRDGIYIDQKTNQYLFSSLDKVINKNAKFIPLEKLKELGLGKYLFLFKEKMKWEEAIIAGGCFWGVQELYRTQNGVLYSEVGYTGGKVRNAQYEDVKTGLSGHAEAVRILFDPKKTNYTNILLYFFKIHDPTTMNQQGNDVGTQYRSEIFYLNPEQLEIAKAVIKRVDRSKNWGAPVVTKLSQAKEFYRGEESHQDYLVKHPGGYTCHFPRKFDF